MNIKKLIALFFLCLSTPAYGETVKLLDAVTGTGTGPIYVTTGENSYPTTHSILCHYTDADAGISAVTVVLQGILVDSKTPQNETWINIYTYAFVAGDITAKNAAFSQANMALKAVRLNYTLTGDGAGDSLTCYYGNEK